MQSITSMATVAKDGPSVTRRAYAQLKSDLIACRLAPGKRITISKIQRETGFSQAAVREALSRLTSEGLVEAGENAGFRATAISTTGFRELAEASMVIELPCLQSAIEQGDFEWEGKLVACYHVSSRLLPDVIGGRVDLDKYVANRAAFYDVLFAPCANRWLLQSWKNLYIQQMRYRHRFYELARYEAGLSDHYQKFIRAARDRRVEEAMALCRQQYQSVIAFMEQRDFPEKTPQVSG